jgi:hypothetical protein
MRKFQQRQILELLQTIDQAQAMGLFAHCQRGAQGIIEFIEHIEGEGTQTVALLVGYHELLFRANEGKIGEKKLRKHLTRVENSVRSELAPNRIEVVFLCYKASMSDSLETIYLAARADPNCDAYWIAIPYYDYLSDGSFGEMYYEGPDSYAGNIEVTDWREYDIAARHPDAIFTMNPYDGSNIVTSVHPGFYSSRIKAFTDLLVYVDYGIPYWVLKNPSTYITPENVLVLPAQHFCDLYPIYSKELAESVRTSLLLHEDSKKMHTKQAVMGKVIALGSAKFDRLLRTNREDCVLSKDWQTMIGGKKVLLYNTSISAILQGNERFLEKLRSVIETVSRRDDIVLWWRPHPLSENTYRRMRPHLMAEYEKTVMEFRTSGGGIYDDTPDLHRAITLSDACLSDESSILFLYLATGKPFSITSIEKVLPDPVHNSGNTFHEPLKQRVENMKAAKGANVGNWNCCIWWDNFLEEDHLNNVHYDNFLERFIHYVVHGDEYPEAEEYRRLQLQMLHDFVENPDGTAGQKIYDHCKQRLCGAKK